jgi:hypothetical protein
MQCSRCQHENPSGVKFCGECGARLKLLCPSCREANPPTNKFCGQCGAALVQSGTRSRFTSPHAYTRRHLVDEILTSESALEGSPKQITVQMGLWLEKAEAELKELD